MKKISIVIPAHNEEGNVSLIRQRIADVFSKLEHYTYEIIFVNDGSRDNTQQKLEELAAKFDEVKYIEFSRKSNENGLKWGKFKISSHFALPLITHFQRESAKINASSTQTNPAVLCAVAE